MNHQDEEMVAAVVRRYGPPEVVELESRPVPVPGPGQALVRIEATAVNSGDARIRGARFPPGFGLFARAAFGVRGPRRQVLGNTFSGVVESFGGPEVDRAAGSIRLGDPVCGMTGARMGAHATHLVVDAERLVPVPGAVTHDQAAGVLFGGTTAAHFLRRVDERRSRSGVGVGPSTSVLVVGASGAVGTNAVQLAAARGATVTGVCSGANAELVRGLGADEVIDHGRVDLAVVPTRYDVVFDTVGRLGLHAGRRLLRPGGVLVLVAAGLGETVRARGDVLAGPAPERTDEMADLLAQVADGRLRVVLDVAGGLGGIVEAYRRVDSGRKVGNIVLRTDLDGPAGDA